MKALLLAAGYGTRLQAVSLGRPKPLLPVQGIPLIEYTLLGLESVEGLSETVVVTNETFAEQFRAWRGSLETDLNVTVFSDGCSSLDERLGSVGDIAFVVKTLQMEEDLLVVGGDNLFDLDLDAFRRFAQDRSGVSTVCYDVGEASLARLYSTVVLEQDRIVQFTEKDPNPSSTLVGICVYYYPKENLDLISKFIEEGRDPDASGNLLQWLVGRVPLYGMVFEGHWLDIGTPEEYERSQGLVWLGKEMA